MTNSKTQIDRLGDRLREGILEEADLRQLDAYRRSFAPAYDEIVSVIRRELATEPTGRPAKSTPSIVEKLQRESIRLSQMQDIAGCRFVVPDIAAQDGAIAVLKAAMPNADVVDRRQNPSHGYRGVHVIATVNERSVEIQIRTEPQHLWAEISEKLADLLDPGLKYGRGPASVQTFLRTMSNRVGTLEKLTAERAATLSEASRTGLSREVLERMTEHDRLITAARQELDSIHQTLMSIPAKPK
ncbi:MAG: hypothetical protein ACREOG_23865 [Gemmatimonadaceae bacterium]